MDRTFSLFLRLPLELRLMIWEFFVPLQPRIIEIRLTNPLSHFDGKHDFVALSPSILHTCHDSRCIGLKTYKLSFSSPNTKRPVYFNPDIDSLFLRERFLHVGDYLERDEAKRVLLNLPNKHEIQRLKISFDTALLNEDGSPPVIFDFLNLKELTFVRHVIFKKFPCREPCTTAEDYYLLDRQINTSSTPSGFTHFVKESQIRSVPKHIHMLSPEEFCLECPRYNFAQQTNNEYSIVMGEVRELEENGFWDDRPWNRPKFRFEGISYNTIPDDHFFHKYEPYNFRPTTKQKTLESQHGISYGTWNALSSINPLEV